MLMSESTSGLKDDTQSGTKENPLNCFHARYASFNPANYPRDLPLPACTLAKYGFHYDRERDRIRCVECGFEHEASLQHGLLHKLLHRHHQHQRNCSQVLSSLADFLHTDPSGRDR
jgi:hypothetical protein